MNETNSSNINNDEIKSLVRKVKILKENSDYRCGDIVYHKGERWEHSKNEVLNNPKYENTIFRNFLKNNKNNDKDLKLLLKCIEDYSSNNNLSTPADDEIVMHLRMGDIYNHYSFLNKDYVSYIKDIKNKNTINKITIVTSFAYQVWSDKSLHLKKKERDLFTYTDEKQKINRKRFSNLLTKIKRNVKLPINIYSNNNIDLDLCYCVFSKHFIKDGGGFSELMEELNQMKLNK